MQAVRVHQFDDGGPESIRYDDAPQPTSPGVDQVKVRV